MKYKSILLVLAYFVLNDTYANDDEFFFVAYSSAQASGLPNDLKKQMSSLENIDAIAVAALKSIGQNKIANEYFNHPEIQRKLRDYIRSYIGSSSADSIFDDMSTKLYGSLYTVDELQALYQLNTSKRGKNFLNASIEIESIVQNSTDNLKNGKDNNFLSEQQNKKIIEILEEMKSEVTDSSQGGKNHNLTAKEVKSTIASDVVLKAPVAITTVIEPTAEVVDVVVLEQERNKPITE